MAEGTGIAGLAGSLAEKLARDVRCVGRAARHAMMAASVSGAGDAEAAAAHVAILGHRGDGRRESRGSAVERRGNKR